MSTLTIELEDEILARVRQYSKKKQVKVSDILSESLRRFLLMAELSELQDKLDGKAAEFGFDSEEDLFDTIS
ncbi:DUF6364 family protein [Persicitalea jodogahamensis]|uniref:CopG family transcriptional regulator n=1 Tax=Persicitalea jodogahamensis TaxID=402147 RepID=A0A8J3G7W4_9BACT|nr:DUF6364 family protein [Persicitalea jodogahamensis]GHB59761.1 hypothetical protein GCM10007390_11830 [Persicitalea jodogahamensis]